MHIQFTHAEDLHVDAASQDRIEAEVRDILGRFEGQLTAVVFHFNDQNAGREGGSDKYCSAEARPHGHQAIAVHHTAGTVEQACTGAAKTLLRRLDTVLGKRADVKGGKSIRTGL